MLEIFLMWPHSHILWQPQTLLVYYPDGSMSEATALASTCSGACFLGKSTAFKKNDRCHLAGDFWMLMECQAATVEAILQYRQLGRNYKSGWLDYLELICLLWLALMNHQKLIDRKNSVRSALDDLGSRIQSALQRKQSLVDSLGKDIHEACPVIEMELSWWVTDLKRIWLLLSRRFTSHRGFVEETYNNRRHKRLNHVNEQTLEVSYEILFFGIQSLELLALYFFKHDISWVLLPKNLSLSHSSLACSVSRLRRSQWTIHTTKCLKWTNLTPCDWKHYASLRKAHELWSWIAGDLRCWMSQQSHSSLVNQQRLPAGSNEGIRSGFLEGCRESIPRIERQVRIQFTLGIWDLKMFTASFWQYSIAHDIVGPSTLLLLNVIILVLLSSPSWAFDVWFRFLLHVP